MAWFKNVPFLSLVLLLITYSTFGWYIDDGKAIFGNIILEQGRQWEWQAILSQIHLTEDQVALALVYLLALSTILLITIGIIAPVTLITIMFGSGFKSDARSIISILLWSLAIVFMLRWITFFARFFLLLCAAILAKLDLQDNGYQGWQVFSLVTSVCFIGFMGGVIAHSSYVHPVSPLE